MRAIWHDGQFTYLKSDATELPALYELKDGKPAVVNFQVQTAAPTSCRRCWSAATSRWATRRSAFEQRER